ncbi:trafficking protein particle complex subunit 2-like protein [Zopfochytrium polystomum]|nr:trafficking protein particle complex subunit 2-like protein [Zopfochytrium polystomum]
MAAPPLPPPPFDVQCIAVIGKQNNPLFIKGFSSNHQYLKFQYCCHTACDVIEERVSSGAKHSDLYLGLLYAMEDLAVFGYMTNTKVKFVVIIGMTETSVKDSDMKILFRYIHSAYVSLVSNPFWDAESKIVSKRFINTMTELAGKQS